MKSILFFLALLSMFACKSEHGELIEILDFEKAVQNSKAFDIKEHVSNIRYIPLETKEECFIADIRKIVMHEDYFLISDSDGNLFQFNSTGKFIRRIGKIGKGPGEYINMTDFEVDHSFKNIYVNTLGYLYNYDLAGNFKSRLPLNSGNLQVLCMDSQNRLFYIMPDAKQAKGTTSFDIVYVYDLDGQILDTIKSNTVRTKGIALFNNIYEKNDEVFYKEEFAKGIFRIDSELNVDTVFHLEMGKYAFEPEDLNMSKKDTWEDHYRLYNMFSFEHFIFFNMQKGLMGLNTEVLILDRKKHELIYPKNVDESGSIGVYLDGAKLTPVSDYNDDLVCVVSIEDIVENRDKLLRDLKAVSMQINENSNPVLAVFKVK